MPQEPDRNDPRCADGGYLVNRDFPIPDAPRLYLKAGEPIVGCNRIYCPKCEEWVRHRDGVTFWAAPDGSEAIGRLFDDLDEATEPMVTPLLGGANGRIYVCRCAVDTCVGLNRIDFRDTPWVCGGHPQGEQ